MPGFISDSPLARDLIRIGDEAIARQDGAALRAYFAEDYVFHGPGGDLGFDQLSAYFASLRAAFTGLRLAREQIITDGNFLAARTVFSGDFTAVFTYSPIGPVEPTGQHLQWEVIGTFRYHDNGRLAEEWVQTDYRSLLTKLGVTTTESVERSRLQPCSHRPSAGHHRTGTARTSAMPPDNADLRRARTVVPTEPPGSARDAGTASHLPAVSDATRPGPTGQAVSRYSARFALPPLAVGEATRTGPQDAHAHLLSAGHAS